MFQEKVNSASDSNAAVLTVLQDTRVKVSPSISCLCIFIATVVVGMHVDRCCYILFICSFAPSLAGLAV